MRVTHCKVLLTNDHNLINFSMVKSPAELSVVREKNRNGLQRIPINRHYSQGNAITTVGTAVVAKTVAIERVQDPPPPLIR